MSSTFGGLARITTTDTITTNATGGTFDKLTSWNLAMAASVGVTASAANDTLTCPIAGDYRVHFSITVDGNDDVYTFKVYKAGSATSAGVQSVEIESGRRVVVACTFFETVSAGQSLDVRVAAVGNSKSLDIVRGQFTAELVSGGTV